MKIYSKLLGKIRKNKDRIKKTIGIFIVGVGIRSGSINSSPTNLPSNSTQQIERVDTFGEEHIPDDKVQEGLSHKSSGRLIKTGSGVLIGNKRISEHSKSALEIRNGGLGKSGPGPRAKADARKAGINRAGNSKAKNLQSDGSSFAEAFTTNHPTQSRPGQNKDGLFSRFPSQARPNPYNPGCSKGPKSVHPLASSNQESVQKKPADNDVKFHDNSDKKESSSGSLDYKKTMRELDRQSSKKRIDVQVGDQIYILQNPYHDGPYELGDKLADQIYESIRESDTDICDIAQTLGFKAKNIKNVKDHVFYNEHDLDRYGPDQIERKQFDPNLQQALAWKRLETGTHTQDDVTWIKHECAERHHELKYGSGYNEAHNRAQTRFDGEPWENQF